MFKKIRVYYQALVTPVSFTVEVSDVPPLKIIKVICFFLLLQLALTSCALLAIAVLT